jgi:hypothetical protein
MRISRRLNGGEAGRKSSKDGGTKSRRRLLIMIEGIDIMMNGIGGRMIGIMIIVTADMIVGTGIRMIDLLILIGEMSLVGETVGTRLLQRLGKIYLEVGCSNT